jgi:hypothetical protein
MAYPAHSRLKAAFTAVAVCTAQLAQSVSAQDATPTPTATPGCSTEICWLEEINKTQGQQTVILLLILGVLLFSLAIRNIKW